MRMEIELRVRERVWRLGKWFFAFSRHYSVLSPASHGSQAERTLQSTPVVKEGHPLRCRIATLLAWSQIRYSDGRKLMHRT